MAGSYNEKIIYGFSKIHLAKWNAVTKEYDAPVPVLGAKNVEVSYEISENKISADNKTVWANNLIASGSGTLEVLGLTVDEKALLFGTENYSGGFAMGSNTAMPQFALLFQQEKADGGQILHCIYNVSFAPAGISCQTLEDGQIEETTESLEFTSILGENGFFFYSFDTKDAKADSNIAKQWFTAVQEPQEME